MLRFIKYIVIIVTLFTVFAACNPQICRADPLTFSAPYLKIGINKAEEPGEVAVVLQIFLLLTVLSLAPAILIMLTSFARIVIVLSLLRQAIGTHQMPPNQIVLGLALFLTFFIMTPVWQNINKQALQPYLEKKITHQQALEKAFRPIRQFMFKQTREKDLALLVDIAKIERPKNTEEIPITVLIPCLSLNTRIESAHAKYEGSSGTIIMYSLPTSLLVGVLIFISGIDAWLITASRIIGSHQRLLSLSSPNWPFPPSNEISTSISRNTISSLVSGLYWKGVIPIITTSTPRMFAGSEILTGLAG